MVRRIEIAVSALPALVAAMENPRPLLEGVGALLVSSAQKAFSDQRLGREKWPARYEGMPAPFINIAGALSYLNRGKKLPKRIFQDRPALRDTNSLFNSLSWRVVKREAVEAGSKVPYAARHQFGQESRQRVTSTARKTLTEEMRRARGAKREALRKIGFFFNVDHLDTDIHARPFLGITDELEKDIITTVEDFFEDAA